MLRKYIFYHIDSYALIPIRYQYAKNEYFISIFYYKPELIINLEDISFCKMYEKKIYTELLLQFRHNINVNLQFHKMTLLIVLSYFR